MALSAKIFAQIKVRLTDAAQDFGTPVYENTDALEQFVLASGNAANQVSKCFADRRTIAASSNDDIDLTGGGLTDPLNQALNFGTVKAIYVKASAANTNNVVVGGAGTGAFNGPFNAATAKVSLEPGAVFLVAAPAAGWAVTATSADLLRIANSAGGTSVTYDIIILGST
jgi:hypothetical protein